MRKASLKFLEDLLNTPSPGGGEARIQKLWCDYLRPFADEVKTDCYGNAVAILNPGAKPMILLDGHCDEIALMVKYIDEKGFIYVQCVGGIDANALRTKRVDIHTTGGPVRGVVGSVPSWLRMKMKGESEEKAPKIHELWIDIGAESGEEASSKVTVGDLVTFTDRFEMLSEHVAVARACDDRVGIWLAAETLRRCSEQKNLVCSVVAVSSVQEETGCHGAKMIAQQYKPDAALALEVAHATDCPTMDQRLLGKIEFGKGPTVSVGRENHPAVVRHLRETGEKHNIPIQLEAFSQVGGTNAMSYWTAQGGIPSTLVAVPNRYMHSTVETIDLRDLEATAKLLTAFCTDLKESDRFAIPM